MLDLKAIFDPDRTDPEPADMGMVIRSWDDLPADWRIDFEERAAVMEYDGGLTRETAEVMALGIIVRRMMEAGIRVVRRN